MVQTSNREHSHWITLMDVLISYNFNSLTVVHYLVSTLIEDVEKIETELQVSQIACFVRLFMDCGVFKNTNVREILTFLAEHIRPNQRQNEPKHAF